MRFSVYLNPNVKEAIFNKYDGLDVIVLLKYNGIVVKIHGLQSMHHVKHKLNVDIIVPLEKHVFLENAIGLVWIERISD
jgi:hypothetical protein